MASHFEILLIGGGALSTIGALICTARCWSHTTRLGAGCPNCGYSRDGLETHALCPECGLERPTAARRRNTRLLWSAGVLILLTIAAVLQLGLATKPALAIAWVPERLLIRLDPLARRYPKEDACRAIELETNQRLTAGTFSEDGVLTLVGARLKESHLELWARDLSSSGSAIEWRMDKPGVPYGVQVVVDYGVGPAPVARADICGYYLRDPDAHDPDSSVHTVVVAGQLGDEQICRLRVAWGFRNVGHPAHSVDRTIRIPVRHRPALEVIRSSDVDALVCGDVEYGYVDNIKDSLRLGVFYRWPRFPKSFALACDLVLSDETHQTIATLRVTSRAWISAPLKRLHSCRCASQDRLLKPSRTGSRCSWS